MYSMFHLINFVDSCKRAYFEYDASSMFQTKDWEGCGQTSPVKSITQVNLLRR